MTQSDGLAAEIATPSAHTDNGLFVSGALPHVTARSVSDEAISAGGGVVALVRHCFAELVLNEALQSPCVLRLTQIKGLAAEIATAAARNDNWVFVPAIEYFDVFAEPLECNNIMKLRCTNTTRAFL